MEKASRCHELSRFGGCNVLNQEVSEVSASGLALVGAALCMREAVHHMLVAFGRDLR